MDYPNILSKTILDEIESLPGEFREKSEEVRNLQKELNELKTNYNNKENTLNKLTKEIISLENDLVYNYDEVNNFKSEQKIIITELDEEAFNLFRNNFYKLDEEYYKKILCFLKYENDFEEELNFLLLKPEDLHELLRDSYNHFKSMENNNKYQEIKNKILNNKKRNTIKLNLNINKNKINDNGNKIGKMELSKPFNIIFNFIENTFKIIDINNKINEIKTDINNKNEIKEKLYIETKLLKNTINEKQENLNNINIYIKRMNNILIKFKNFFGNHNHILKNKAAYINNNINNNEKIEMENNHNNIDKKILYLKNNINNSNILINNNEIINSNLNNFESNSNNFYHSVNNCSKNNLMLNKSSKSNSSLDNSSSNISPNNIKIISINSNTGFGNPKSSINKKQIVNTPKNSNAYNRNRVNLPKSNSNSNENKKIKIGSLPLFHQTHMPTNKNHKIIKTNSYEKDDTKKISLNNMISSTEHNNTYKKSDNDYFLDENISEKNSIRTNPQLYHSLKLLGENIHINLNKENVIKNMNKIKIINDNKNKHDEESVKEIENKEANDKDKETIVDNYNNNILVEFKKDENNKKDFNRNKKLYNNTGIYNNNRKIIKMIEKKKLNANK